MPDSGVVFDASTDRLLISTNVLNMNSNYTVIGRSKLNSDLNAAGIVFVLDDNNVASLAADYLGVASDGTGLAIDAIIAGSTTTATGSQLRVGVLFTWGLRRIGNRLEAWLNGQLNCFLNVSISGRAAATRLEVGAATTSNLSRTDGTHGNLIAYPYALDPRQMAAQMGNLDCALFPNVYGFWKTPKGTTYRAHDFSPNGRNFTEGGTLADAPLEPVVFDPIQRWWVRGKFTWNATLTGSLTPSGALVNQPTKLLTGGMTPAGSLSAAKIAILNVTGAVSSMVGALVKQPKKLLSGGATPTGAIVNQPKKLFSGGSTPSGALVNRTNKLLSGALSSIVGVLIKQPKKLFTGGTTPSGTLANQPRKLLSGVVATISGGLINQPKKVLGGGVTPSGALTAIKIAILNISGAITPTGVIVNRPIKLLSGSASSIVGALIKQPRKVLAGGLTPGGLLSAIKTSLLFVSGSITPTGLLTKRPAKVFGGGLTPSGALSNRPTKLVSGTVSSIVGALVKRPGKVLSGANVPAGAVRAQVAKALAGIVNSAGSTRQTVGQSLSGVIGSVGSLIRSPRKILGGLIDAIGDFIGTLIAGGGVPEIDLDPDAYSVPRRNTIFISERANEEFESQRTNEVFIVPRE